MMIFSECTFKDGFRVEIARPTNLFEVIKVAFLMWRYPYKYGMILLRKGPDEQSN